MFCGTGGTGSVIACVLRHGGVKTRAAADIVDNRKARRNHYGRRAKCLCKIP